jgi:2-phosphosulfolactate phosphatase
MIISQTRFDVRREWGRHGVATLAPVCDAIIIVDVLSFCSAVSIAVSRGALVFPCRLTGDAVHEHAKSLNATAAGRRGEGRYSLSPCSMMDVPSGTRIVLPSPNGSALTLATGSTPTFAGCLRNSGAVARAAASCGSSIGVIPAGERWKDDDTLRPAIEDLIGAGAIISHLSGTLSPEAAVALAAFRAAETRLQTVLEDSSSGQELAAMDFARDVAAAAVVDADDCAPIFIDGAYQTTALD